MASSPPTVLILGHSFVRRLCSDLSSNLDTSASEHFDLLGDTTIHLHSVAGLLWENFAFMTLVLFRLLDPIFLFLK